MYPSTPSLTPNQCSYILLYLVLSYFIYCHTSMSVIQKRWYNIQLRKKLNALTIYLHIFIGLLIPRIVPWNKVWPKNLQERLRCIWSRSTEATCNLLLNNNQIVQKPEVQCRESQIYPILSPSLLSCSSAPLHLILLFIQRAVMSSPFSYNRCAHITLIRIPCSVQSRLLPLTLFPSFSFFIALRPHSMNLKDSLSHNA